MSAARDHYETSMITDTRAWLYQIFSKQFKLLFHKPDQISSVFHLHEYT